MNRNKSQFNGYATQAIKGYSGLSLYLGGTPIPTLKSWVKAGVIPSGAIHRPTRRTIIFRRGVIDRWIAGEHGSAPLKRTPGRPRKPRTA